MARVRLIHWNANDAPTYMDPLRAAGFDVQYDGKNGSELLREIRNDLPDLAVISLARLPSYGLEFAIALRGSKATRQLPIVFVDGAADKVARVRERLPDAVYTRRQFLVPAVKRAIKNPLAAPVVPTQMMDRYHAKPAAEKLGIRPDTCVALLDAPLDYSRILGELPRGVDLLEEPLYQCPVTLWFVRDIAAFRSGIGRMRQQVQKTKFWIAWQKQTSTHRSDLNENLIRATALEMGLVDYKICSIDPSWSAILVTTKKLAAPRAAGPISRRIGSRQ